MRIIEALGALQFLTKKLISLSDVADALGKTKGAINNRHNKVGGRSDELKPEEIKQLEVYFNVGIEDFVRRNSTSENSAQQTKRDKKELAETVKKVLMETLIEYGGNDAVKKLLK